MRIFARDPIAALGYNGPVPPLVDPRDNAGSIFAGVLPLMFADTQIAGVREQSPGAMIPFRRATTNRVNILQSSVQTTLATAQQIELTIEGSGYMYGIDVSYYVTTGGNSAAVTYAEDGPWNAAAAIVLRDVNGELVNLDGFSLRLANLYSRDQAFLETGTTDISIYRAVTSTGATGGSFRIHLWVPCGINRRSLAGIVGNQDRAQKFSLRTDIAAGATIYGTVPTTQSLISIERHYDNYSVPNQSNANGAKQAIKPATFGLLHFLTKQISPTSPAASTVVPHFLGRVGNTLRLLILVFRSGTGSTPRAQADTDGFSRITFYVGDTPVYTETPALRRAIMFRRYGFDAPAGVYVYDALTDFKDSAGSELGNDWLFTQGLVNSRFEVSYNAGWAAGSTLTIITDDLIIPPGMDVYAALAASQ